MKIGLYGQVEMNGEQSEVNFLLSHIIIVDHRTTNTRLTAVNYEKCQALSILRFRIAAYLPQIIDYQDIWNQVTILDIFVL